MRVSRDAAALSENLFTCCHFVHAANLWIMVVVLYEMCLVFQCGLDLCRTMCCCSNAPGAQYVKSLASLSTCE